MCLVAAVTGALDAHHNGKGSLDEVFDLQLVYLDGSNRPG